jgi:HEAT repeat protein
MSSINTYLRALIACAVVVLLCSPVLASPSELLRLSPSATQAAIAVGASPGRLHVAACAGASCDWERGLTIPLPDAVARALRQEHVRTLQLAAGQRAIHVRVPVAREDTWEAVIHSALKPAREPVVAFEGFTGLRLDANGERRGHRVQITSNNDGTSTVVIGTERDDVTLCGRPTLLAPKVLLPRDLRLHRLKLQRLTQEERASALSVVAAPAQVELSKEPLMRALAASSAIGRPDALSDADAISYWAENKAGGGRGEFVVMDAPIELPIAGFSLVLPSYPGRAEGTRPLVAPERLWIATDDSLYSVRLPPVVETGSPQGFAVQLPGPIRTSCVALVLESAQVPAPPGAGPSPAGANGPPAIPSVAALGIAEFDAKVEVDEQQLEVAVQALDGQGPEVESAQAFLAAVGQRSLKPLLAAYTMYSAAGRARALNVLDRLPCGIAGEGYAAAVEEEPSTESDHALRRLRECGRAAAKVVSKSIAAATGRRLVELSYWLAQTTPNLAVRLFLKQMPSSPPERRRVLRSSLATALATKLADQRVEEYLDGTRKLRETALIDLMRALGPRISEFREPATRRLTQLLADRSSYRTRYLLLEPMANLAVQDPVLAEQVKNILQGDPNLPVRARAARLMPPTGELAPVLLGAVSDPAVRVREAAIANIEERQLVSAEPALVERLERDSWPLVRAASVRALNKLPASASVDRALAKAVRDASPMVRRPAIVALGQRHALAHVEALRYILSDADEDTHVRAAAAAALGQMCDRESVEPLTQYAGKLQTAMSTEAESTLGRAALMALGRLAPPDLERRLAGFQAADVPVWARRVAAAARTHPQRCPSTR